MFQGCRKKWQKFLFSKELLTFLAYGKRREQLSKTPNALKKVLKYSKKINGKLSVFFCDIKVTFLSDNALKKLTNKKKI